MAAHKAKVKELEGTIRLLTDELAQCKPSAVPSAGGSAAAAAALGPEGLPADGRVHGGGLHAGLGGVDATAGPDSLRARRDSAVDT